MLSCLKPCLLQALAIWSVSSFPIRYISVQGQHLTEAEIPAPVVLSIFIQIFYPLTTDLGNQKRKEPVFRFVSKVNEHAMKDLGKYF